MMKNAKLVLATLAGISVSSAAFVMANEGNAADAKMVASDIALAQKHFKAINETDIQKKKALFEEVYDPKVHFASPRGIVDGRAELEKLFGVSGYRRDRDPSRHCESSLGDDRLRRLQRTHRR
jgi:hypothetical protein